MDFSFINLLRAARGLAGQDLPPGMRLRILLSYAGLILSKPSDYGGELRLAGFRVRYCNPDSLLFMFGEIFLRQTYRFTAVSAAPFILDCGANIGLASLYFKSLYPAAEILAFEPDPAAFERLEANLRANGAAGVTARRAALTSADGTAKFFQPDGAPGSTGDSMVPGRAAGREIEVPALKLSSFINREVELLKMDIEGAETQVLPELAAAGKLRLVRQILLEYHHHIDSGADYLSGTLALLEAAGFGYQFSCSLERPFRGGRFQDVLVYAYRKT